MAVYTIQDTTLTDIADAIREKTGQEKPQYIAGEATLNPTNLHESMFVFYNAIEGQKYRLIINFDVVDSEVLYRVDTEGWKTGDKYYFYPNEPKVLYFTASSTSTSGSIQIETLDSNVKVIPSGFARVEYVDENNEIMAGVGKSYKPSEMADAISGLQLLPEVALNLTGDCQHMFRNNKWNWLIEQYGDKITTDKITNIDYMFYGSTQLKEIPFVINMEINTGLSKPKLFADTFAQTNALLKYPQFNITSYGSKIYTVILDRCANEEPNIVFSDTIKVVGFEYDSFLYYSGEKEPTWIFDKCDWEVARNDTSVFGSSVPVNWTGAYYIKTIPSMPKFYTLNTGSYYHHWYQFSINHCHNLKEIVLPRPGNAVLTSTPNGFNISTVPTLKSFKFDVQEDNTPYTAQWKNITLTLTSLGWGSSIYTDKEKWVSNDETYLKLKDDDEYWASSADYSGYNHDRAVETINSLPDTSAYGTNTVKFKGVSGSKTDGGAINTLTEEEIAVATAKGWTVSLV